LPPGCRALLGCRLGAAQPELGTGDGGGRLRAAQRSGRQNAEHRADGEVIAIIAEEDHVRERRDREQPEQVAEPIVDGRSAGQTQQAEQGDGDADPEQRSLGERERAGGGHDQAQEQQGRAPLLAPATPREAGHGAERRGEHQRVVQPRHHVHHVPGVVAFPLARLRLRQVRDRERLVIVGVA